MDELPANDAPQAKSAEDEIARMLAEETRRIQDDASGETQLLEDETILLGRAAPAHLKIDEEEATRLMSAVTEAASLDDDLDLEAPLEPQADVDPDLETQLMPQAEDELPEEDAAEEEDAPQQTSAAGTLPGSVPGVIPLDETVLRPVAVQSGEEHYVVRNTRDYDHDAQSVNVVGAAENFETITEPDARRNSRRERRRDPYASSAHDGGVPGEGNSRSKLRPLLAMLLIALVLSGGAAVASYGMELWGGKTVPSLVGDSQETAEERLREKGLVPRVEAMPSDEAYGKVMEQDPAAGTRIPEGDEVTIVIATNRTMPDVVGMYEEDALNTLREAGAENVVSKEVPSDEPEGIVLEVSPAAGEAFVSHGEIVLTIAGWYHVPDVVGKKEQDAVQEIEAAGLQAEVSYVVSSETVRTVVETEPVAGEAVSSGTVVQVRVSTPYPTDVYHLSEYFSHSSQDINSFLEREGFRLDVGQLDNNGNAVARYLSDAKGTIIFTSRPYTKGLTIPQDKSTNVLSTGAPFAGIRFECSKDVGVQGHDAAAVEALATNFGLTGKFDVTDSTMSKQFATASHITVPYACAVGTVEGTGVTWTILITGEGENTHVIMTCAREGVYASVDLGGYNNSLAWYVIAQELGQSASASTQDNKQNGEEKKDDEHANSAQEGDGRVEDLAPGI